uniref:Uncharacterized protein n=1 Tax=Kalanchoe fedtschenkoi TaxID=63787 RepID=A0A7N0VL91_KALFE
MGEGDVLIVQPAADMTISEDKILETVISDETKGAGNKETTEAPMDEVASEEKQATNNLGEMQLDNPPAKGLDVIGEKLKGNLNIVNIEDSEEEKRLKKQPDEKGVGTEKSMTLEKVDIVTKEGKSLDPTKENGEASEIVKGELKNENESERKDDSEDKRDGVVDPNEMSARSGYVQVSEQYCVEDKRQKKSGQETSDGKNMNGKSKDSVNKIGQEPKAVAASSFAIDRPVRDRKSVERLVAVIERDPSKDFHIEKGNGTALKDIPNVAYKLSRKKSDDTLKLLHSILFSRRGKAADIKNHISKFSGFVWHGNEEKQKLKIKEKLEKCFKEKLFEFCDILDITVASKANVKKDEVVSLLLEFLVSPHATTDEILAEKEESSKGKKRKRVDQGTPRNATVKTQKKQENTDRTGGKTNSAETEDEAAEDTKEIEDVVLDGGLTVDIPNAKVSTEEVPKISMTDARLSGSEDRTDEDTKQKKRKRTHKKDEADHVKTSNVTSNSKKTNGTPGGKTKKTTSSKKNSPSSKTTPCNSMQPKIDADGGGRPKVSSRKQKDLKAVKEKIVASSKEKVGKEVSKGKEKTTEKQVKPTDEKLREETCKILKEVDFNTG